MAVVAQSPEVVNTVPGRTLTEPDWLAARITEMGHSWGTTQPRIAGTLWWCMVVSALVEQIARAYAHGEPAPEAFLDRLDCEVRPDGGIERVHILPLVDESAPDDVAALPLKPAAAAVSESTAAPCESGVSVARESDGVHTDAREGGADESRAVGIGAPGGSSDPLGPACVRALRETLATVIAPVAAVSGAGVPSLWAIAADAIGNRALDAGAPEAGARLAEEVGGKLPVPRFVNVGGRTFVRRISCCLVFEVPGCEMCTSCPKRPAAERKALLTNLAAES